MEFSEIVNARYAAKKFDGRMADEKTMDKLLDMIRLASSSFNFQPWRIKIITDAQTKEALLPHSWNQPQIPTCSHLLVFCADTDLEARAKGLYSLMRASGMPAESVDAFAKHVDAFAAGMPAEARLNWAQHQVYLAVANALNGAKSLGLDSCPMEGFIPKEYARILNLPAHLVPSVVVPVGYAADTPRPKVRFEKKDVFF